MRQIDFFGHGHEKIKQLDNQLKEGAMQKNPEISPRK